MKVPDILLSGDHNKIKLWRENQMKIRTINRRNDMSKKNNLNSNKPLGSEEDSKITDS